MKYENFELAKSKVEQIDKLQKSWDELASFGVEVQITRRSPWCTIMTIGTDPDSEHPHKDEARIMVDAIARHIQNKINTLKEELAEL